MQLLCFCLILLIILFICRKKYFLCSVLTRGTNIAEVSLTLEIASNTIAMCWGCASMKLCLRKPLIAFYPIFNHAPIIYSTEA